jgi:hypothetical protein
MLDQLDRRDLVDVDQYSDCVSSHDNTCRRSTSALHGVDVVGRDVAERRREQERSRQAAAG